MTNETKDTPTPVLRIKFEDGTGRSVMAPIEVRFPPPADISLRVAKILGLELVSKKIKAALGDALKAMGFK